MRRFIIIFLALIGCTSQSEEKAIESIEERYGGECVKKVVIDPFGKLEKKALELSIKGSESLIKHFDSLRVPSSNIALLAFKELTEEEIVAYDKISIEIFSNEYTSLTFSYQMKDIQEVLQLSERFKNIVGLVEKADFENLSQEFRKENLVQKEEFAPMTDFLSSACGTVTNISISGFSVSGPVNELNSRIRILAILTGEKGNVAFFIEFFRATKKLNRIMTGFPTLAGLYN